MQRKLTNTAVKAAKAGNDGKKKKYSDGGGLFLIVSETNKSWRYSYRFMKKQRTITIGKYPEVSLADARRAHEEARGMLARGVDPSNYRKTQLAHKESLHRNSFEVIASEWLAKFSSDWSESHRKRNEGLLRKDVFPYIGARPVAEIEPPEVLAMLNRIVDRGARHSAYKTKQVCGQVFRYAVVNGLAERDPTPDLKGALPAAPVTHMAAITDPSELGCLLRAINGYGGEFVTRCALQLLPLVFVRPGELRHAEWSEFDFDVSVWTIPAGKMKARREHKVPLSLQALKVLEEIKPLTGAGKYVFPSVRHRSRAMSNNTINAALRRMGYTKEEITGHGFRSTASTLLNEMGYNRDAVEVQLSHVDSDQVRAAYNRGKYWEERVNMMREWGGYLQALREGAEIIPLNRAS